MNRTGLRILRTLGTSGLLVLAGLALATPARASMYFGFQVGVTNAPPAPVVHFLPEPRCVRATDAMVFVVQDDRVRYDGDLFRYGQYWFAYDHGYWYRARSHRGPFDVLDVRHVPRAILGVPRGFWKHHPMALAAADRERRDQKERAASDHARVVVQARPNERGAGGHARRAPGHGAPAASDRDRHAVPRATAIDDRSHQAPRGRRVGAARAAEAHRDAAHAASRDRHADRDRWTAADSDGN